MDVTEEKLHTAKALGATDVINASQIDPIAKIYQLTDGLGGDYSQEAGGSTRTIGHAFESVRDGGGQCVFASHPSNELKFVWNHTLFIGENF